MPSQIQVDKIIDAGSTSNKELAEYSSGNWNWGSGLPSGSIVQVQFHQYGGLGDNESGSMTSVASNTNYVLQASGNASGGGQTGVVDVSITPRINGSKMWLQAQWFGELNVDAPQDTMFFFWRSVSSTHTKLMSGVDNGNSTIGLEGINIVTRSYEASHVGSTPEQCTLQYFDTHGVSAGTAFTYKLGVCTSGSVTEIFTNRCHGSDQEVGVTSLCVIELAP